MQLPKSSASSNTSIQTYWDSLLPIEFHLYLIIFKFFHQISPLHLNYILIASEYTLGLQLSWACVVTSRVHVLCFWYINALFNDLPGRGFLFVCLFVFLFKQKHLCDSLKCAPARTSCHAAMTMQIYIYFDPYPFRGSFAELMKVTKSQP